MKSVTVILAVSILVMTGVVCRSDQNSDAKAAIQSGMDKAMQLIEKGNFDELTKLCTPDCKFIDHGKTTTVEQSVAMMKAQKASSKDAKMTSTILTCKVSGSLASCTTHNTMTASIQLPDKKWHKYVKDGTSKDMFTKSGGSWLLKSITTVTDKQTLDGKPYDPSAAGGAKK